mmetsp:Transcript_15897/g.24108  ORF Transcript_15897/g.24108 Transcript_15897/m.24108 type:complete len:247 (+) Transcript_15897:325-1065(+)
MERTRQRGGISISNGSTGKCPPKCTRRSTQLRSTTARIVIGQRRNTQARLHDRQGRQGGPTRHELLHRPKHEHQGRRPPQRKERNGNIGIAHVGGGRRTGGSGGGGRPTRRGGQSEYHPAAHLHARAGGTREKRRSGHGTVEQAAAHGDIVHSRESAGVLPVSAGDDHYESGWNDDRFGGERRSEDWSRGVHQGNGEYRGADSDVGGVGGHGSIVGDEFGGEREAGGHGGEGGLGAGIRGGERRGE